MTKEKSNNNFSNDYLDKNINKRILILSNTSRYIFQYRLFLLSKLRTYFKEIYILAPSDKTSSILKDYGIFQDWNLSKSQNYSLINLIESIIQLLIYIKKIRPNIVHSHTLKSNLLVSIINFFFGINTIISFAGMGRLSNSRGFKKFLFRFILKTIYFLSIYQLDNFYIKRNYLRVKFIFQNPLDLKFFVSCIGNSYIKDLFNLIPGSGVPERYLKVEKISSLEKSNQIDFIYCARLENSKGIKTFINLSKYYPDSKFFIYGDLEGFTDDYLKKEEISYYKRKNKNLLFMDYVKDPLLKHNNDNSILVIPSNYGEGLPRAILEALSLEIPIVASKKACVGLFNKNYLFIATENNLNSYLEEIEKILVMKKNQNLKEFSKIGKDLVKKEYTESINVEKTLRIYQMF